MDEVLQMIISEIDVWYKFRAVTRKIRATYLCGIL